ncbi:hypothetical protein [uncultured Sphingomonas sp.]|uniref:hypothetical protein n=1 Tax=uncultured Sphingomonas sp. TaxID=158754 RepID=UPI0025DDD60E|nr:hypothetical protein [uncultured Sphingomonas sp.]
MRILPVLLVLPLLAGGCVVKTAVNVATLPVKAGAKAVDWTTTSQDEADRNRGRKMRKHEKECRKHPERCQDEQR